MNEAYPSLNKGSHEVTSTVTVRNFSFSMKSKERQGWSVNGNDSRSLSSLPKPSFGLRRTSSKESVQSMLSPGDKNAEEFRTCEYCLKLLKHRDAAIDRQTIKPIVTQFYERLWEYVEEGTTLR